METLILNSRIKENIDLCAGVIRTGGLVAFPTETVYGLGANALSDAAVAGIYTTKGRQNDNPLIVHVAALSDVERLVTIIPDVFETLARKFWPGPLTLIMQKSRIVPNIVSAGLDTVAIRIPEHPVALALIQASGFPIAAPSANPSGKPSPTKAKHVKNDLDGRIPYILDGGSCRIGLESTVLDISGVTPQILRPGGVTYDELSEVLESLMPHNEIEVEKPRSPGMKYRHYAPNVPLIAVSGSPHKTAKYIEGKMGDGAAALMFDDHALDHPCVVTYGKSVDHSTQATKLFDALRELDCMDINVIYAQLPSEGGMGHAVANRIMKAAEKTVVLDT